MIDLAPEHLALVRRLLVAHVPECEVRAFGSRVAWTAKSYSDLDLALVGAEKLAPSRLHRLREAFEESSLPIRVDVLDWHAISESFQKIISELFEVIQQPARVNPGRGEWQETTLGVEVDLLTGFPFKSDRYTDSDDSIRLVRGDNIVQGAMRWDGVKKWPSSESSEHLLFQLRDGDVVLAMDRPWIEAGLKYAAISKYDLPCLLVQRTARLRAGPRLDTGFLRYIIGSREFTQHIHAITTGTAVPHISGRQIKDFAFALPPLAEQKAIAAVLGALDDKIELNRRMNATLEAMARALFQSWFVDFDPVRAKLDGRQPVGLDPATAALFPAYFQESAVGHIPHGWQVGVLDELTKFVIGGDWGATEPTDAETVSCYCIRGADIPSLQSGGVGKMPTRFLKPSSVEKRQLADGDLAIEISGGSPTQCTGRPVLASDALLQSIGQPLVASNFCRIVKLKSPALSKFVYLWLRRLYDAGELFQFETGTTGIKNFAFVIFSERYPLVVPDLRVAEAFDRIVSPFFAQIQANSHESRTLATLRDTLLPKLLSGELSVAENFVGDVT